MALRGGRGFFLSFLLVLHFFPSPNTTISNCRYPRVAISRGLLCALGLHWAHGGCVGNH